VPQSHIELETNIVDSDRSALATGAAGFIGDVNAIVSVPFETVTFVCQRFFSGHAIIDPPITFPIGGATVRRKLGTQRRRINA